MDARVTPAALRLALRSPRPPLVIDVRRNERFFESPYFVQGALRRDPARIEEWKKDLPEGAEVVVYCVHGLEIGQNAAEQLRAAGWNARFLQGGIEGWAEAGLPTARKDPA